MLKCQVRHRCETCVLFIFQTFCFFLQGFHISAKSKQNQQKIFEVKGSTNRSISSSPPKTKVGKGALNSAVVYSSSTMMALAFCDACEMKKIPLQSWCSSSSEDLAAHARDTRVEEMNLESSQGVEVVEEARERGGSMMIIL